METSRDTKNLLLKIDRNINNLPKRRSYPPSCNDEILFYIVEMRKPKTPRPRQNRGNNTGVLERWKKVGTSKNIISLNIFTENETELASYSEILPPTLNIKKESVKEIYDQATFKDGFSLYFAISNINGGNDELKSKNRAFITGFNWNFDYFISPEKFFQTFIIYYRLNKDKTGFFPNVMMTVIREFINSRYQTLKNDKRFKQLFIQFVEYLDKLPENHYGQLLLNNWMRLKQKSNKRFFASTSELWLTETPFELFKTITEYDALLLARQLTNINQQLVQDVPFEEYKKWGKNSKDCPNIKKIITWFNEVTLWVQTSILELPSPKKQMATIIHWIKIMNHMVEMQNYEGIGPIFFGVSSPSSISRFDDELPKDIQQLKQKVELLLCPNLNYQHYRYTLQGINKLSSHVLQQCVLLKDLSVLEENETYEEDGKINWFKLSLLGELMESIRISKESFKFNGDEPELANVSKFIVNSFRSRFNEGKLEEINLAIKKELNGTLSKSGSKKHLKKLKTSNSSSPTKMKHDLSISRTISRTQFSHETTTPIMPGFFDEISRSDNHFPSSKNKSKRSTTSRDVGISKSESSEKIPLRPSTSTSSIFSQLKPERRNSESVAIKRSASAIQIVVDKHSPNERINISSHHSDDGTEKLVLRKEKDMSISASLSSGEAFLRDSVESPSSPLQTPREGEIGGEGQDDFRFVLEAEILEDKGEQINRYERKNSVNFGEKERERAHSLSHERTISPEKVRDLKSSFQNTLQKVRNRTVSRAEVEMTKKY